LFAFYWIQSSGLTRYRWYQSRTDAEAREVQDDLLSGFISALMNFSKEMFGQKMAHIDVLDYQIFFSHLENKDILALVTTKRVTERTGQQLINEITKTLMCLQVDAQSCHMLSNTEIDPLLLDAIGKGLPKSFEKRLEAPLSHHRTHSDFLGYLILGKDGQIIRKEIKDDIDFEAQTFLESVFWEKSVMNYKELAKNVERDFKIPNVFTTLIRTSIGFLTVVCGPDGILSESFTSSISISEINGLLEEYRSILEGSV
jgi:hypothetical protein